MIRHRTKSQVKQYDIFKLLVILILIVFLFFSVYGMFDRSPTEAVAEADADGTAAVEQEAAELDETTVEEDAPAELAAPTLDIPGAALTAGALALTGTGEPGSQVEVVANGESLGTTTVGDDGTWAFDTDLDEPGDYDLVVNGLDADGNTYASSEAATLSLTTPDVELALPTFDLPSGDLTPGPLALTGTGEPGSQVEVVANGESLGTTTVGDDGTWAFDTDLDEPGEYDLVINGLDADGNTYASSEAAILSLTAPDVEFTLPTFDLPSGGLTAGALALTGTGEPGSEVEVVANGESLGTTTVGDDGTWAFDTDLGEPGEYDLVVNGLDADGNVYASSEATTLPLVAPEFDFAVPTFDLPSGDLTAGELTLTGTGEPGSEVEITSNGEVIGTATVDDDGTWAFDTTFDESGDYEIVVNALDEQGQIITSSDPTLYTISAPETEVAVPTLDLPSGELTAGELTLTGTGEPGSEVEITSNGEVIGTAAVDDDGTWSFDTTFDEPGEYELVVNALDEQGQIFTSSDPTLYTISAPETEVAVPTLDLPSGELTAGELTLTGTGEPGSEVEIMSNGEVIGTATVDDGGTWAFDTTFDESGDYEIVVNALDEQGQIITSSDATLYTITAPAAELTTPVLTSPQSGETLPTGRIVWRGTATPGSQVEIVVDGESVGTARVQSSGRWIYRADIDEPGDYEVVINSLDSDGEPVDSSTPLTFSVVEEEEAAPDVTVPTLDLPAADLTAGDVTLTGTGEPGSQVEIVIDGVAVGTTTVDADGTWSFDTTLDQPGEVEVVVNALDAAGDVVDSSETTALTLIAASDTTSTTTTTDESGLVCEEEYIVVVDDWLSKLADKYFSDLFLYPAIVTATNQKNQADASFAEIENPDVIEPGWKLCIVDPDTARTLVGE